MGITKVGDWEKVALLVANLAKEMEIARTTALKRWGLKAEGLAKGHMSKQDLGWVALKPETIAEKIRKGHSENILIATSDYFQAITSWHMDNTVYAGVKKIATNSDGEQIADIAATHEYGSDAANIPPRPLWQPVFLETMQWFNLGGNSPVDIFNRNIKKYGV